MKEKRPSPFLFPALVKILYAIRSWYLLKLLVIFASCTEQKSTSDLRLEAKQTKQADIDFSDLSVRPPGEMGYTYGNYTFTTRDTSLPGTYVSIWKKNNMGRWKFVLDTGNPGVGNRNK